MAAARRFGVGAGGRDGLGFSALVNGDGNRNVMEELHSVR
jgi:hypothetical protein